MIEWDNVEKDLRGLAHNSRYELGTTEYHAERILNYFKDLIAKEFKLVARGKVEVEPLPTSPKFEYGLLYELSNCQGKNIEVYIREE